MVRRGAGPGSGRLKLGKKLKTAVKCCTCVVFYCIRHGTSVLRAPRFFLSTRAFEVKSQNIPYTTSPLTFPVAASYQAYLTSQSYRSCHDNLTSSVVPLTVPFLLNFALYQFSFLRCAKALKMGAAEEVEYSIKPENSTPAIPTSEWPLLLKNYDKCMLFLLCDVLTRAD
jgi:hypothetical protein